MAMVKGMEAVVAPVAVVMGSATEMVAAPAVALAVKCSSRN